MWWEALLWSLLAGVGGTLIGALIPISVHGKGEKVLSLLMAFTAGFLDVLPESLEAGGKIWLKLLITLVGAAIVFAAGLLLDKKSGEHKHAPHIEAEIADEAEGKRDLYVGLSLAVALVLHNIPEGMAVGFLLAGFAAGGSGISGKHRHQLRAGQHGGQV